MMPTSPKSAARGEVVESYGQCRVIAPAEDCLSTFDEKPDSVDRKCRIICTMGPSCWDVDMLVKMIDAGMNVARLNFSHGDHAMHGKVVASIREAAKQRPDKPVAILLDTKGPEIRTGFFRDDAKVDGKIELEKGQELKIVTDYEFKGDNTCIAVSYAGLCKSVKVGGLILCADGSLSLKIKAVNDDHVITEVMNSIKLGERKNCNLPGVKVELPVLQEKDVQDLLQFGVPQGVDFVAASFVQSADDVKLIKKTLGLRGRSIKVISKIENEEGLINFNEICDASDGIMVARGDLGMEIPTEKVFLAQKMMISRCNLRGKPVITATQMLESMCKAPRPTRAEAGDVANAVLDGTDCVMLSGETAGGDFPVEAVTFMRRIVEEAEKGLDYMAMYLFLRQSLLASAGRMSSLEAYASTAVKTAADCGSPLMVVLTGTGSTCRLIAKYRPKATVLAVTKSEPVQRQLLTLRGVISMIDSSDLKDPVNDIYHRAIAYAKELGIPGVSPGAKVVVVNEEREGEQGAAINAKICKLVTIKA